MFERFLNQTYISFSLVVVLVPILQWLLWRIDKRWVAIPVAALIFAPAWTLLIVSLKYRSGETPPLERWEFVYLTTGSQAWPVGVDIMAVSSVGFFLWKLISRFSGSNIRGEKVRPLPVGKVYLVLLVVFWTTILFLGRYETLQYAVESNNEALAERRLEFNLEGLGPNDGRIVDLGSHGLISSPLLPLAVATNSKGMVRLLVGHGADLNPVAANELVDPKLPIDARDLLYSTITEVKRETLAYMIEQNVVMRNSVALAIQNENSEMLEYLIELGADPSQGLFTAVILDKPVLFHHLLQQGAEIEVVRRELRDVGKADLLDGMIERTR